MTRFTDLTAIASGDIADTDVMALSDVSAAGSFKATIATLKSVFGAELTQLQVENPASTVFGQVSGERLGQAIQTSRERGGAIVATTSGTAFDFTGIPAEVQEITVLFRGVSLSGSDGFLVQMGTSGGVVSTGYVSTGVRTSGAGGGAYSSTSGMVVGTNTAAAVMSGAMTFTRFEPGSNVWVQGHKLKEGTTVVLEGSGDIDLGAEVDRIRITRTGTNTFDAGQLNVRWK